MAGPYVVAADSYSTNTVTVSPDAQAWTGKGGGLIESPYCVCCDGPLLLVAGDGSPNNIAYSEDRGETWVGGGIAPIDSVFGIAWSESQAQYVAVGDGTAHTVMTSPDGKVWTGRGNAVFPYFGGTVLWCEDLGLWVAGGGRVIDYKSRGVMATSPNGETWTEYGTPVLDRPIISLAWSPTLPLLVAVSNANATSTADFATSPDAAVWTARSRIPMGAVGSITGTTQVVWAPALGLFCAVGRDTAAGYACTSADGIDWVQHALGLPDPRGVCAGDGLLVAVGQGYDPDPNLSTSPNGIDWTASYEAAFQYAYAIGYGLDRAQPVRPMPTRIRTLWLASPTGERAILRNAQ